MITETKIDMTFFKLFLNGGLIFMTTMVWALDEWNYDINYRLPDNVIPIHYNIWLRPFIHAYSYIAEGGYNEEIIKLLQKSESAVRKAIERKEDVDYQIYFYGQSHVKINILRPTQQLIFHSLNLHIDEKMTMLISKNDTLYKPSKHLYDYDVLILNFKDRLSSGYYNLKMKFVGTISKNIVEGFFMTPYEYVEDNVTWIAVTYFQPMGARQVFPCWDEPSLKATFSISIKHSTVYSALSNMPKIGKKEQIIENKTILTEFHTTPNMSTYLVGVALAVKDLFSEIQLGEVKHRWRSEIYVMKNLSAIALTVSDSVMRFFQDEWINYIKFPKLEHIIIPDFQTKSAFLNNGMDNWGMIIYGASDVFYDELDPISRKIEVTRLIAFKIARQVFVNLVSPSWWSHMWMNEGLAQFFGIDAHNQIYPEQRIMDLFVVQDQQESLRLDTDQIMRSLIVEARYPEEIEDLFSSPHYAFTLRYKAPIIFRMLQHIVTNKIFKAGINRYLDRHSFSSAHPDNLWDAVQAILDESNGFKDTLQLKEVMNSWINKINYPVVNVDNFHGKIIIGVDYFNIVLDVDMWWIPLTYTTQRNLNFHDTSPKYWLDSATPLEFPKETGWIIVNLQQAGYYRVNYYSENWWKIAKFLNSDEYKKIHVLNRAQIIDDAYYFLERGNLELPIFLELTKYLSRETDYVAWYPMFKIFEKISRILPFMQCNMKWSVLLKIHIRNILNSVLKKIEYEESYKSDLTTCLRQEAIKWACLFGDYECVKNIAMKLYWNLDDFEEKTHLPIPKCKAWRYYKSFLKKDIDPDIMLEYIKFMIPKRIAFINRDLTPFWAEKREKEYETVLDIIANNAKNTKILEYLLENFHQIPPKQLYANGQVAVLITIINHVYCNKHLNMISNMLTQLFPYQKRLISIIRNRIVIRMSDKEIFYNYIHLQYSNDP